MNIGSAGNLAGNGNSVGTGNLAGTGSSAGTGNLAGAGRGESAAGPRPPASRKLPGPGAGPASAVSDAAARLLEQVADLAHAPAPAPRPPSLRRDAERLFMDEVSAKRRASAEQGDREIVRRYVRLDALGHDRDGRARAIAEAHAPEVHEAHAALTRAQRAAYDRVAKAVAGHPTAQVALQLLLTDGKLTGGPRSRDDADLLAELDAMATQKVEPPMKRGELLAGLLVEVALPATIFQGDRGTCAAAASQHILATENPAELVRLCAGLASPSGYVKLEGKGVLRREPGTEEADGSGRTDASRLVQSAMMEYANGDRLDFDNFAKDEDGDWGAHSDGSGGLSNRDVERLLEGLTGRDATAFRADDPDERRALRKRIQAHLRDHGPVAVGLDWGPQKEGEYSGHEVVVTKIADGVVHFVHGHAQAETMDLADFTRRLSGASF